MRTQTIHRYESRCHFGGLLRHIHTLSFFLLVFLKTKISVLEDLLSTWLRDLICMEKRPTGFRKCDQRLAQDPDHCFTVILFPVVFVSVSCVERRFQMQMNSSAHKIQKQKQKQQNNNNNNKTTTTQPKRQTTSWNSTYQLPLLHWYFWVHLLLLLNFPWTMAPRPRPKPKATMGRSGRSWPGGRGGPSFKGQFTWTWIRSSRTRRLLSCPGRPIFGGQFTWTWIRTSREKNMTMLVCLIIQWTRTSSLSSPRALALLMIFAMHIVTHGMDNTQNLFLPGRSLIHAPQLMTVQSFAATVWLVALDGNGERAAMNVISLTHATEEISFLPQRVKSVDGGCKWTLTRHDIWWVQKHRGPSSNSTVT